MSIERRRHERIHSQRLVASLTLQDPATKKAIDVKGQVLNFSYSGIRMKLESAMPPDLTDSDITIKITLPDSGLDVAISGHIRHISKDEECGMEYSSQYYDSDPEGFIFECIKKAI